MRAIFSNQTSMVPIRARGVVDPRSTAICRPFDSQIAGRNVDEKVQDAKKEDKRIESP